MMMKKRIFLVFLSLGFLLVAAPVSAKLSWWDAFRMRFDVFVDKEDIHYDIVPVDVIQDTTAPLFIKDADIKDKGTSMLKMKGLEHSFTVKVENISPKNIVAYQIVWQRHLPFAEYAQHDFRINSKEPVARDQENTLEFRRPIHNRSDAHYKVYVAKVLFTDGTEWHAEHDRDLGKEWAEIKQEIDQIKEGDLETDIDLDALQDAQLNSDSVPHHSVH